jgi:hypothetical protein
MRRVLAFLASLAVIALGQASTVSAQTVFVNGFVIPGDTLDATNQPGANGGRFGFFSDIYYDPTLDQWWALSDRGPGGGLIAYDTRMTRFQINVHPVTGAISQFRVIKTIKFTDPDHLLAGPGPHLNGLNPLDLNGSESVLGHSFDPEGLVIDPNTGEFIVVDEYGPSVYVFDRQGRLRRIFDVPENLVPFVGSTVNYVALRDACGGSVPAPLCGANGGRQDNRGYEGLAVSPDGTRLYAVLQDPLIDEPPPNDGRTSRNVRIVVYDNDHDSPGYGTSLKQFVYQLELQSAVAARINAQIPGNATATDPRQGRNIGVSAIVAINDAEFLILERDNRGIGVDDPAGARAVGSKRVFKIDISGATDVTNVALPAGILPAGVVAVTKSPVFLDLQLNTLLPNGEQAEKWEGLTIGPRLKGGDFMLLAGNDNDYSVTQTGAGEQFDVYVDFNGEFAWCVLDDPTHCDLNPTDLDTTKASPLPAGYQLLPGVLHAFRTSALAGYVEPNRHTGNQED